jgi:hypothetical protein
VSWVGLPSDTLKNNSNEDNFLTWFRPPSAPAMQGLQEAESSMPSTPPLPAPPSNHQGNSGIASHKLQGPLPPQHIHRHQSQGHQSASQHCNLHFRLWFPRSARAREIRLGRRVQPRACVRPFQCLVWEPVKHGLMYKDKDERPRLCRMPCFPSFRSRVR